MKDGYSIKAEGSIYSKITVELSYTEEGSSKGTTPVGTLDYTYSATGNCQITTVGSFHYFIAAIDNSDEFYEVIRLNPRKMMLMDLNMLYYNQLIYKVPEFADFEVLNNIYRSTNGSIMVLILFNSNAFINSYVVRNKKSINDKG